MSYPFVFKGGECGFWWYWAVVVVLLLLLLLFKGMRWLGTGWLMFLNIGKQRKNRSKTLRGTAKVKGAKKKVEK